MTDPIADMLTRIRNAADAKKAEVCMPFSKMKFEIAQILKKEGWILDVEKIKIVSDKNKSSNFDQLRIVLKYKKSGRPAITNIKRISKPGLRIYVKKDNLPKVLNNLGIAVLSTPGGLITNKEAHKKGLGGEVICEIY
jgi:small subunit ribosomal protein S8